LHRLAQVTVEAKSSGIPAFTPLLTAVEKVLGSLTGILFVADTLHTQTDHAARSPSAGHTCCCRPRATSPPCTPNSRPCRGRRSRSGTGPAITATLRNTAIGWHRINGETNIARANRRADRRSNDLLYRP
jgi:hypothetical protein